jgi:Ca-activated chloride channel homolog
MRTIDAGLFSRQGIPIPLLGVGVVGEIVGQGGRITVSQRFRNVENQAIEAVYKFPLPEGAAVCGFTVEKEDARISGHVEERDKAFEIYDDALQEGKGGYLLDEERPNIFTLSVGNLNPGTEAMIHIEYVTLIDGNGDTLRFLLPTTITPRYIPDHQKEDGDIPLDHRIHPPYAQSVPYGMEMRLTLATPAAFSTIESPSHPIRIEQLSDHKTVVSFTQESVQMDRDFILTLTLRDPSLSQAWLCRNDRGTFLQLDLFLDDEDQVKSDDNTVFFVVDCSGSMEGDSIHEARQALDVCLKAIEEGTRFNIVRFGSHFESLFPEPRPYSEATLNTALAWTQNMQADMGGTEILAPLQHIYKVCPPSNSRNGAVLLLTDGAVGNEDEILSLVRGHSDLRVFSVGIGAGCNEAFIRGLARSGKGASTFIYPGERMGAKILHLFGKISEHSIEPAIDWGNSKADQAPADPVIYARTRTSVFARFEGDHDFGEKIEVTADVQSHSRRWSVPILPVSEDHPALPLLWARERIRELEDAETYPPGKGSRQTDRKRGSLASQVIALSKAYGILSRHTSFVAVEEREEKDLTTGEILLRKIPVLVTMGWHGMRGLRQPLRQYFHPGGGHRPLGIANASMWVGDRGVDSFDYDVSFALSAPPPPTAPSDPAFEMVMSILKGQRAKGGFKISKKLARELGIFLEAVLHDSEQMTSSANVDKNVLLWSALLLQILERCFAEQRKSWEKAVRKTRTWIDTQISAHNPTLHGVPLMDWAAEQITAFRIVEHIELHLRLKSFERFSLSDATR